jgi:hypothetical protein
LNLPVTRGASAFVNNVAAVRLQYPPFGSIARNLAVYGGGAGV